MTVSDFDVILYAGGDTMAVFSDLHDYILDMIENELSPGDKLPGARRIAELFSCSLPRVQAVLDSLEQSGVVAGRARSGTFVSEKYREQLLPQNVVCSKFINALPEEHKKAFRREFPDMHLSGTFISGGVEILSSFTVLARQQHYLDISSLFHECFPDSEARFYMEALRPFEKDGRLFAVPVMFSPQLLWYNPEIFRKTGTPEPLNTWGEKEFFAAIRSLYRSMSGRRIINYSPAFQHWISFVFASGGVLFDSSLDDPVLVDSPRTVEICVKYAKLLKELDLDSDHQEDAVKAFARGKLAMFSGFRQNSYFFREYNMDFTPKAVCMPDLGSGEKHLGAGLIAFRKSFNDPEKIKKMLKFWLSDPVQESLGRIGYGVPFLRSAAANTLDRNSEPDRTLLENMPALSSNYHIYSEDTGSIVTRSSRLINTQEPENIPSVLKELATAMRYINKLKRNEK